MTGRERTTLQPWTGGGWGLRALPPDPVVVGRGVGRLITLGSYGGFPWGTLVLALSILRGPSPVFGRDLFRGRRDMPHSDGIITDAKSIEVAPSFVTLPLSSYGEEAPWPLRTISRRRQSFRGSRG